MRAASAKGAQPMNEALRRADRLVTVFGWWRIFGPSCRPCPGQRRLARSRRGAPAGPRFPSSALRQCRPDHGRSGQSAFSRFDRCRAAQLPMRRFNLVGILRQRGAPDVRGDPSRWARPMSPLLSAMREFRISSTCRRLAPIRIRPRPMAAARRRVKPRCGTRCPARSSCGPPSCLGRKIISSIVSPGSHVSRQSCR